jgi:hypothetical protein
MAIMPILRQNSLTDKIRYSVLDSAIHQTSPKAWSLWNRTKNLDENDKKDETEFPGRYLFRASRMERA